MGRKKGCDRCEVTPIESGYYWATSRKYENWSRVIVWIGKNGHGRLRVYVPRFGSSSFGLEDFKDWSGPVVEKPR